MPFVRLITKDLVLSVLNTLQQKVTAALGGQKEGGIVRHEHDDWLREGKRGER